MESEIVNPNFVTKFNVESTLEWLKFGIGSAKAVLEVLKQLNEKLKSEKLTAIIEKVEKVIEFLEKLLNNKALTDFVISLINMFVKKNLTQDSFKQLVVETVLNSATN